MAFTKYTKGEQVEVVAAADAPETLRKFGVMGHNHVTDDIKDRGECPACDRLHAQHEAEENLTEN